MHPSERQNPALAAFTLVELSVVIIILSLITAGGLAVGSSMVERQAYIDTRKILEQVEQSLRDYYIVNGRLPCVARLDMQPGSADFGVELGTPAGCTGGTGVTAGTARKVVGGEAVRIGMIPVRTLGLTDAAASDKYGNRILYAVTEGFTVAANFGDTLGAITVRDGEDNDITTTAAYILVSHGRDRRGGRLYTATGSVPVACGTVFKLDRQNCNWDSGSDEEIFRDAPFNNGSQDNFFFDDLVKWAPGFHLMSLETKSTSLWASRDDNDNMYSVGQDGDPATGFTGLGTVDPQERLHVIGNSRISGDLGVGLGSGDVAGARLDINGNVLFRGESLGRRIFFYAGDATQYLQLDNWQLLTRGNVDAGEMTMLGRFGGADVIMAGVSGYRNSGGSGYRLTGGGHTVINGVSGSGNNYTSINNMGTEKIRLENDYVAIENGYLHAEPECQIRTSNSTTGTSARATTASCNSDEYLMSGGGHCNNDTFFLTASHPNGNGWYARCIRNSGFSGTYATAYAKCCKR